MTERIGIFFSAVLVLSFFVMHQGAMIYGRGMHSQDLGWNLKSINQEFDVEMIDYGVRLDTGETVISTDRDMILGGIYKMNLGLGMMLWSTTMFVIVIGYLLCGNVSYKIKRDYILIRKPWKPLKRRARKKLR